jgi:hypothetical protein
VLDLRSGWRDVLDRWNIEALVVPPSCAVAQALLLDPDWQVEYRDSKAIILFKRRPNFRNAVLDPETYPPDRRRPTVTQVTRVTK